MSKCITE